LLRRSALRNKAEKSCNYWIWNRTKRQRKVVIMMAGSRLKQFWKETIFLVHWL